MWILRLGTADFPLNVSVIFFKFRVLWSNSYKKYIFLFTIPFLFGQSISRHCLCFGFSFKFLRILSAGNCRVSMACSYHSVRWEHVVWTHFYQCSVTSRLLIHLLQEGVQWEMVAFYGRVSFCIIVLSFFVSFDFKIKWKKKSTSYVNKTPYWHTFKKQFREEGICLAYSSKL